MIICRFTYEETADGIKRTGESVDAEGKTTSFEYTAKYHGKDYPVTGPDLYDTITGTNPKGKKMHSVAVYDKQ